MPDARRFFSTEQDIDKSRHRLPHWQQGAVWCFATWRLADSLPASVMRQWEDEREMWFSYHPKPWDEATERDYHIRFTGRIERWLDQGSGSCPLRHSEHSNLVALALRHWDGERYELCCFVIMPNHIHVLFRPMDGHDLTDILKAWKGFTARQINLQRSDSGTVWQKDYWDLLIRNEKHFLATVNYIQRNPLKARLRQGEFLLWPG